jgi:L-2,4-diaminobutyric acid acetyltransferase
VIGERSGTLPLVLTDGCHVRCAEEADAAAIWQLVSDCPELDSNSFYSYYLLCRYFSSTCVVAEQEGRVAGFVTAFISPDDLDLCFVWQLCVDPDHRGSGIASDLLDYLITSQSRQPRFIEATVAPGNVALRRAFQALARRFQTEFVESACLSPADFPDLAGEHAAENLLRVGELRRR